MLSSGAPVVLIHYLQNEDIRWLFTMRVIIKQEAQIGVAISNSMLLFFRVYLSLPNA